MKNRITEFTVHKEIKVGLPNYSNITASAYMTVSVDDGEKPDWAAAWDTVNHQLSIQTGHIEPEWMNTREYQNYFKTTIKTPKQEKMEVIK